MRSAGGAEYFVKVGTMARIAEHMDRHWWSAAVQEAGTDALIALLPRHLFAACKSSSTGAALANVLRGTYPFLLPPPIQR